MNLERKQHREEFPRGSQFAFKRPVDRAVRHDTRVVSPPSSAPSCSMAARSRFAPLIPANALRNFRSNRASCPLNPQPGTLEGFRFGRFLAIGENDVQMLGRFQDTIYAVISPASVTVTRSPISTYVAEARLSVVLADSGRNPGHASGGMLPGPSSSR
jgi:hypothetical protein